MQIADTSAAWGASAPKRTGRPHSTVSEESDAAAFVVAAPVPPRSPAVKAVAAAADGPEGVATDADGSYSVLQAFGMTLKVSNPRLAELLTMDAREALTTDLGELTGGRVDPEDSGASWTAVTETAPEPVAVDEAVCARRRHLADYVAKAGSAMGFQVCGGGLWRSPSAISLVVRVMDADVTIEGASHFAGELAAARTKIAGPDSSVLFVADGQAAAGILEASIRNAGRNDRMRTISAANLGYLTQLVESGAITHLHAVMLLAPIAEIDPGEIVSALRASHPSPEG